ncbi:MAG TPA: chemotaxis protein CheX [Polyangiaceae bacterium]|nr:chemotaxis protein CheX [Polyangiaceae bacterium]
MPTFEENDGAARQVVELAALACCDLFAAYGVPLSRAEHAADTDYDLLYCGVMGFVGKNARGMCLLGASREPIERTAPVAGDLRDWLGELTNQLVGRLKGKLLARGVEIALTTPLVLKGHHIAPLPRRQLIPEVLVGSCGRVLLWADVETAPGFSLTLESEESVTLSEGGLLFF